MGRAAELSGGRSILRASRSRDRQAAHRSQLIAEVYDPTAHILNILRVTLLPLFASNRLPGPRLRVSRTNLRRD